MEADGGYLDSIAASELQQKATKFLLFFVVKPWTNIDSKVRDPVQESSTIKTCHLPKFRTPIHIRRALNV